MEKLFTSIIGISLILQHLLIPNAAGEEMQAIEEVISRSTLFEVLSSIERGGQYLIDNQLDDGSWANHPVITSLATLALVNSPKSGTARCEYAVNRALDYVARQAKDDGGIWSNLSRQYPLYSTALSTFALVRVGREKDQAVLRAARDYLLNAQIVDPDSASHGGFAVDNGAMPTLTTTQWVLEALFLTDHLENESAEAATDDGRTETLATYQRAQSFIERCQQLRSTRRDDGVLIQGGYFNDFPQDNATQVAAEARKVPGTPRSRAFLTCAGVKSLVYARTELSDTRVIVAADWLRRNYAVAENPGLGQAGFYTYLLSLTKAMRALEWNTVRTPGGDTRFWRLDITLEMLSRQQGDGSWSHGNPEWWENRPELVTAYGVLMLEMACAPEISALNQPAVNAAD